jgi:hypothetical protein
VEPLLNLSADGIFSRGRGGLSPSVYRLSLGMHCQKGVLALSLSAAFEECASPFLWLCLIITN